MSETPLPTASVDVPHELAGAAESRSGARRAGERRTVSAFAPEPGSARHEPDTSRSPSPEEVSFVATLRSVGLAGELDEAELARVLGQVRAQEGAARRLELLVSYYDAAADALAARRRRATDRWFLFDANAGLDASQLLSGLLDTLPELAGTVLERVGGPSGTLVLRAGDDVCALEDEREDEQGQSTVSVCDLVRALNVLLDRRAVRARLVGLIGDGSREAYLALPSVTAAIGLSSADYLAAEDIEALLDLTAW